MSIAGIENDTLNQDKFNEIEKHDTHAIFDVPAYNENPKRTNPYTAVKDICVEIGWFMVLNTTFHNISVISWQSRLSFIGVGFRSTRRKPQTCRKSLTNFIT
jgi:hypothetical protein